MKELERGELMRLNGGYTSSLTPWLRTGVWGMVFSFVKDNWADIKLGAYDGWTDAGKE